MKQELFDKTNSFLTGNKSIIETKFKDASDVLIPTRGNTLQDYLLVGPTINQILQNQYEYQMDQTKKGYGLLTNVENTFGSKIKNSYSWFDIESDIYTIWNQKSSTQLTGSSLFYPYGMIYNLADNVGNYNTSARGYIGKKFSYLPEFSNKPEVTTNIVRKYDPLNPNVTKNNYITNIFENNFNNQTINKIDPNGWLETYNYNVFGALTRLVQPYDFWDNSLNSFETTVSYLHIEAPGYTERTEIIRRDSCFRYTNGEFEQIPATYDYITYDLSNTDGRLLAGNKLPEYINNDWCKCRPNSGGGILKRQDDNNVSNKKNSNELLSTDKRDFNVIACWNEVSDFGGSHSVAKIDFNTHQKITSVTSLSAAEISIPISSYYGFLTTLKMSIQIVGATPIIQDIILSQEPNSANGTSKYLTYTFSNSERVNLTNAINAHETFMRIELSVPETSDGWVEFMNTPIPYYCSPSLDNTSPSMNNSPLSSKITTCPSLTLVGVMEKTVTYYPEVFTIAYDYSFNNNQNYEGTDRANYTAFTAKKYHKIDDQFHTNKTPWTSSTGTYVRSFYDRFTFGTNYNILMTQKNEISSSSYLNKFEYDASNNKTISTTKVDATNSSPLSISQNTYDALGRITKIQNPDRNLGSISNLDKTDFSYWFGNFTDTDFPLYNRFSTNPNLER